MTNPVLRLYQELPDGTFADESRECDLNGGMEKLGRDTGFLIGYAEGLLSLMKGEIPIHCDNYDNLDEYERMRVRELLVVISDMFAGTGVSSLSKQRIKIKRDLDHTPPRILVYSIHDATIKESS